MDSRKPSLDLEKELTCSVREVFCSLPPLFPATSSPFLLASQHYATQATDLARYALSFSTSRSRCSTASTPFAEPASRSGSASRRPPPRNPPLLSRPSSPVRHAGAPCETPGAMPPSSPCSTCLSPPIRPRRAPPRISRRWGQSTARAIRSFPRSTYASRRRETGGQKRMTGGCWRVSGR